jgi:hypothetical protein
MAAMMLLLLFAPAVRAQWTGGGTQADPYLINNFADWVRLAKNVNTGVSTYSGTHFRLTHNITVEQFFSDDEADTTRVGSSDSRSFRGTFDGDGYTITISYYDRDDEDFCAPFRYNEPTAT